MGDLVNLRAARKKRARSAAEAQAATNRAKFGRTKAEKSRDGKMARLLARKVDHSRLDKE